jgi:hypothetical protein
VASEAPDARTTENPEEERGKSHTALKYFLACMSFDAQKTARRDRPREPLLYKIQGKNSLKITRHWRGSSHIRKIIK